MILKSKFSGCYIVCKRRYGMWARRKYLVSGTVQYIWSVDISRAHCFGSKENAAAFIDKYVASERQKRDPMSGYDEAWRQDLEI